MARLSKSISPVRMPISSLTLTPLRHGTLTSRVSLGLVATTLDIYSHVTSGLQEAAARRFDEGLESPLSEAQVAEVLERNGGKMVANLFPGEVLG